MYFSQVNPECIPLSSSPSSYTVTLMPNPFHTHRPDPFLDAVPALLPNNRAFNASLVAKMPTGIGS